MPGCDAIVIGGGVIGAASAFELARAGAQVVLLERDCVAAHASGAAAGMLAPVVEAQGPGPFLDLALRARAQLLERIPELIERSGIDPGLSQCGALRVAPRGRGSALRANAARLAPLGCAWLEPDELYRREPRLGPGLEGALWSAQEASVDAGRLTRAFAAAARQRGASICEGVPVIGLRRAGDQITGVRTAEGEIEARAVVLCTGAWAHGCGEWLGVPLPVQPARGQMLALEAPVPPPASILWSDDVYLVPRADGSLRVGATLERAGFDVRPTAAGVAGLLGAARALLPDTDRCRFLRAWAGLRPATPDELPLVGALASHPGLWLGIGHYRNGILLSALTGRALARAVQGGAPADGLELLDPCRLSA